MRGACQVLFVQVNKVMQQLTPIVSNTVCSLSKQGFCQCEQTAYGIFLEDKNPFEKEGSLKIIVTSIAVGEKVNVTQAKEIRDKILDGMIKQVCNYMLGTKRYSNKHGIQIQNQD